MAENSSVAVAAGQQTQTTPVRERIASIDALRGFDMFWISGGEELIHSLFQALPIPLLAVLDRQFHHVAWEGFRFYDLIFPTFVFIVGLVLPFSLTRRLEAGGNRRELYLHALRRLALLFLLGLVYNGLLDFNFHELRILGVLQRISIAYFFATLLVMNFRVRGQAIATACILLGYWLIMAWVPVPGFGHGVYTPEGNLAAYLDRHVLPGRLCCYDFGDNEGIISNLPAIASCMLGVLAGHWLRSRYSPKKKLLGLAAAGVTSLGLALLWSLWFPIIKNIWSSSFVLFAGGWSILLLAFFYLVIDIWKVRRWAFFFTVIGANPITIYLINRFFDFRSISDIFIHGFVDYLGGWKPFATTVGGITVAWLFLYYLYRNKIFLKV